MMLEKTRLEEMSMALPEKERKELLERIGRRMDREETEEAVPVELREDEREKILAHEMKKASSWVRFLLWLRTLVSGKSRREVFLDIRLRLLRNHIRSVSPGLTGFDTRDLTPKFARKLYDLYVKVEPLTGIYHALGSDKALRGAAYAWYVEQRWDKARRGVEDFVGMEEMEEIFAQTGQTEEIRKKLSLRLNEYVHGLPESLVVKLEEEAHLHLSLGRLAGYPFQTFFRYFNYLAAEPVAQRYPSFDHAPVMLTLDLMEKLYVAFTLVKKSAPDYVYAEEPISYFLSVRAGTTPAARPKDGAQGGAAAGAPAAPVAELEELRVQVMALAKEIDSFEAAVPLLDLVRYFRRDPWYQLVFNSPRLYLRSLYFSTLKNRLTQELEEKLSTIKERVIGRKIQDMLKGQKIAEFGFYREAPEYDFRKLGLPSFGCVRSLNLLYNYILQQFKGIVQEAAQIVSSTLLANNRITQNRLSQAISGMEDLEARIVLFDRALSPDEEEGKQLSRFRFNVATDLMLQKGYRSFVMQKDRDARDLIDKARDYLESIRKVFDDMRTSTLENTKSLLKTLHVYRGRNQTIGQIVNARADAIGGFLGLMDQVLEIEKGS